MLSKQALILIKNTLDGFAAGGLITFQEVNFALGKLSQTIDNHYDLKHCAKITSMSTQTLRTAINQGELIAARIGKLKFIVAESELKKYIEDKKNISPRHWSTARLKSSK